MKIGIVGLGYIGSVTAVALTEAGYEIVGIDIDESKVKSLSNGEPTIFEPNLKELLTKNKSKLFFSTDYDDLKDVQYIFVVVPTPNKDGSIYLEYVYDAVSSIKKVNKNAVIIIKSTVLPGTARNLMERTGMVVISNPEFTKEGTAIEDTLHPDRVVIGGSEKSAVDAVKKLWEFTHSIMVETTNENAEMIKYASNSFLAVKISFINEIANICEMVPGCDVEVVAKGMGLDKRIAPYFLKAGIGFGGSCFPKDTTAILSFARSFGEDLSIIKSAIEVNNDRVNRIMNILKNKIHKDNSEVTVGVLGMTFKAGTDDTRESQSIKLIRSLLDVGYKVNVYDPMAKIRIDGITRLNTAKECIDKSDVAVIATEWPEFKNLEINTDKFVIDMRRMLDLNSHSNLKTVGYYG
jgi:UDPglucose 6-dehydrogenase